MNDSTKSASPTPDGSPPRELVSSQSPDPVNAPPLSDPTPADTKRWWIRLVVQPILLFLCVVILLAGIGLAQRFGFLTDSEEDGHDHEISAHDEDVLYICPMMCTPPLKEPGRCPVCGMELVPTTLGGNGDSRSIQIDPATRRVANIQTTVVQRIPMSRVIRSIGELSYDEGNLKTISAYVDGRIERLFADYTGVVVQRGDRLALLYSPRLYTSQVEFLLANKARDQGRTATLERVVQSSQDLYENSKRRLIELGMTEEQIEQLEVAGQANSRLHVHAPIGGTVIEKLALEGQYVKEGDAIYRLADLSSVWLMLKLFPEDAAAVRIGQEVEAEVQSLPGRIFAGHVAFKDPYVDPETRTVGVRVVIPNEDGLLSVGDYAKATVEVPVGSAGASMAATDGHALVVPRDAVLMAGQHSVVYVETRPGRFEIRRVVLGSSRDNQVVIVSGLAEGEQVATRGNFLIDSQMQLAGNPSLIDPLKAEPASKDALTDQMLTALSQLTPEDRVHAENQRICPVTEKPLGSMGVPPKVDVDGTPVFICCEGCRENLLENPNAYLSRLAEYADGLSDDAPQNEFPPVGAMQIIEPDVPPMGDMTEVEHASGHEQHAAPAASPMRQVELLQKGLR